MAQAVKNLPARQAGDSIQSLGEEDALEKGMATHSSILTGESHGQRGLVGYSPWGCKELDMTEHTHVRGIEPCSTFILIRCGRRTENREMTCMFCFVPHMKSPEQCEEPSPA